MDKPYIHAAKQGRDEPPAEQCRMGVSMGYPPLTQKNLILKKICCEKNFRCRKIRLEGLCMFCLLWRSCCFAFRLTLFDLFIVLYYSFM